MDMNKSYVFCAGDAIPHWRLIDAQGKVLGRLSTEIANALRGKDKPTYTPHADAGDYVVVINAEKVVLTGKKWTDKLYVSYSGWRGGRKEVPAKDMVVKHPTELVRHAVRGMLVKNKLNRHMLKKLKVYAGSVHPHQAQLAASSAT